MQVILLERIGKLGQMGDVVTVKDGFARNFLLPQGKALRATKTNRERFERDRAQLEARNLKLKTEAQSVADKLNGQSFVIVRQAGDAGQLYGSVSTRDIATAVTEGGFSVERRQVVLDRPIKMLGLHELRIALHAEVAPRVTINVARSLDEAARQARGETVTARARPRRRRKPRVAPPRRCSRKASRPLLPNRKQARWRPRAKQPRRASGQGSAAIGASIRPLEVARPSPFLGQRPASAERLLCAKPPSPRSPQPSHLVPRDGCA